MKLSPLLIFLLIISVLIISVIFRRFLPLNGEPKEGMTNISIQLNRIKIPQYSQTPLYQLYDNVFIDPLYEKIIEIDGGINPIDGSVSTININGIIEVKNDGTVSSEEPTQFRCGGNTYSGNISNVPSNLQSSCNILSHNLSYSTSNVKTYIYNTQYSKDVYSLLYINADTLSFVHIIDTVKNTNVASYVFGIKSSVNYSVFYDNSTVTAVINTNNYVDPHNKTFCIDSVYSAQDNIYQLTHTVKFDNRCGYLIIHPDNSNTIDVYDIFGNNVVNYTENKPDSIPKIGTELNAYTVADTAGNMVLCMTYLGTCIVCIISKAVAPSIGYDATNYYLGNFLKMPDVPVKNDYVSKTDYKSGNNLDNENGWNNDKNWGNRNNYMLKTQIVPPVCPSCPACPNFEGVCGKCGGNGGGGCNIHHDNDGDENSNFIRGNTFSGIGQIVNQEKREEKHLYGVGDVVADVGTGIGSGVGSGLHEIEQGVGGIASGVGRGIGSAASGIGSGVGSGLHEIEQGVGGIASGVGRGIGGIASGVGRGIGSAASGIGSGVGQAISGLGSLGRNSNQYGYSQGYVPQTQNAPTANTTPVVTPPPPTGTFPDGESSAPAGSYTMDPYSYYGALVSKGSTDFMPVTNSFSSFGK